MFKDSPILLRVLKRNGHLIAISGIIAVIEALILIGIPLLTKQQLEILEGKLTPGSLSMATLFVIICAAIGTAMLLTFITSIIGRIIDARLREQLAMDTDGELYEKLASLDSGFLGNPRNRRLIYVFFEISQLPHSLISFVRRNIKSIVSFAGVIPLMLMNSLVCTGIVFAAGAMQVIVIRLRLRRENAFRIHREKKLAAINELVWLYRYHYHELAQIRGENRTFPAYWAARVQALELEVRQEKINAVREVLLHFLETLSLITVAVILGFQVLNGVMTIGTFTMLTMYSAAISGSITDLNTSTGEWYRLRSVIAQMNFFMNMKPRISAPVEDNDAKIESVKSITIEDIKFSYPTLMDSEIRYLEHIIKELSISLEKQESWAADHELVNEWKRLLEESRLAPPIVLSHLNATIKANEITAVIGPNGCGKTTLMRLIARVYDPESGCIKLENRDMRSFSIAQTAQLVTFVPQTPFLMEAFSLRDNILSGCPFARDDEIFDVLEKLGIHEEIKELPRGLDSIVGDEVTLSGGQSQLIAIARAVLQKRPVLILDEGTNQLDSEHEGHILKLLRQMKEGRIIIIITHRMTTARKTDRILVMEKGTIVDEGPHDLLVAKNGLYRKFWEIQVLE
ncbi:ABC transporter ATP-binding protein/permease [Myxococcota bacterium]|nr:ABC transporter ATP-binding protein/permease [Myxococcota bacterium]MBU1382095.1 ABC transporter ATP-binding protein/permease [Myxococcota bacterium]MBU1498098.1 ABC transporter ATP-binding protein/permease [Myxococcota bacterium]